MFRLMMSLTLLCCLSSCATLGTHRTGKETHLSLTRQGRPACTIVIGDSATRVERHAAAELQHYVLAISGASLPIRTPSHLSGTARGRSLVVIGRPETNALMRSLCAQSAVTLSPEFPGGDGFIVKTAASEGTKYLALGGSSDIGTLYAVYDFLERCCGVGFFWDVERVPRMGTISVEDVTVASAPRFARRVNMQGCAYGYSATFWLLDDWKREIDWMAKNKFNTFYYPVVENKGECLVQTNVMKSFGVTTPPPRDWDLWMAKLSREFIAYAQEIGLEVTTPGWPGVVTDAFRKAYPNVDYLRAQWEDLPPDWQIRPTDPMFLEVGTAYLREFKRLYGTTGHLYTFDPYAEAEFRETPEQVREIRAAFAKDVCEMIRAVDPQGEWYMSSWALKVWSMDDYTSFIKPIPDGMLLINDTFADVDPQLVRFNSFCGERWGFGVLQSLGGWTMLHGNIADLLTRLKGAANDPNCVMYTNSPEYVRHDIPYFDALTHAGWDPSQSDLEQWKADFARRRYGTRGAAKMIPFLDELLASVYGSNEIRHPWYQNVVLGIPEKVSPRPDIVSHLRKALEIGLDCEAEQANNECYERDMYETARQYLSDQATVYYAGVIDAVKRGDHAGFQTEAANERICLDKLEQLLASRREYYLQEEIDRSKKTARRGGAVKVSDITNAQDIRTRYTSLIDQKYVPVDSVLMDYAHRDMYELLKYYYRPRVEAYLAYLEYLVNGGDAANAPDLRQQYADLCTAFIRTDHDITMPPAGCVGLGIIRRILAADKAE